MLQLIAAFGLQVSYRSHELQSFLYENDDSFRCNLDCEYAAWHYMDSRYSSDSHVLWIPMGISYLSTKSQKETDPLGAAGIAKGHGL